MPKTKTQKTVFSLLMSLIMVYGMETYNHIIAGRGAGSFAIPALEWLWLAAVVILLQELAAGRLARKIAFRIVNPAAAKPLTVIVAVQIATMCLMCPLMSLVATLAFKGGIDAPFLLKWLQTIAFNIPMAAAWQLLVAGPIVRGVVKRIKV